MKILVGADPELFVKQQGRFLSGYGLIPGTKSNPHPVEKGAVQVDGMALEFNIDPAEDENEFVENINTVKQNLQRMVTGYDLVFEPTAEFDKEYLKEQPQEAVELGCDPDFNAWKNGEVNPTPNAKATMRTAAGHVHVGWTNSVDTFDQVHIDTCCALVRQLDFYLGLPSLLFDSDTKRRAMYGRAGAFRPKEYGAEYRVLSNKWVESEKLTRFVHQNTLAAVQNLMDGNDLSEKYGDIQHIINSSDVNAAKEVIGLESIDAPAY